MTLKQATQRVDLMYELLGRFFEPAASKLVLLVVLLVSSLGIASIVGSVSLTKTPTHFRICDHANISPVWKRSGRIDPAYPIRVIIGKHRFAIPVAYFRYGLTAETIQCGSVRDGVGNLSYSVPALEPPKTIQEVANYLELIKANDADIQVFHMEQDGWLRRKLAGTIRRSKLDPNRPDLVLEYGLWKTPSDDGDPASTFWFAETATQNAVIECHENIPRCEGLLHMKDRGLIARLIFARELVAQHRQITEGLLTLLERWQLPSYLVIEGHRAMAHYPS